MRKLLFAALVFTALVGCSETGEVSKADQQFQAGNYDEAIKLYTEHLVLNPSNVIALYNRGRAYEENKEFEKALADFEKVLEIDQGHVQANLSMAMDLYFRQNDYANSVKYLNNAVDRDKNNAKAYTLRGKAYQRLGDANKAEKDFNTAINVNASYADAYYAKANLKYVMGNKDEACGLFRQADALGLEQAKTALQKYCN